MYHGRGGSLGSSSGTMGINLRFNEHLGDFFEAFLRSELQKHGLTREELAA